MSKRGLWGAAVALAALPTAYVAFAFSLANVTHSSNPGLALRMNAGDPVALATKARAIFRDDATAAAADPALADLAKESLERLALNGPALQLLGIASSASGDEARARALVGLSNTMSRRDLGTQLWMIEDAVRRNDIAEALNHYDIALRIDRDSRPLLFPILTTALNDPRLWPAFAIYIRQPAPWLGEFFRYAISNSERPDALASMVTRAGGLPRTEEFAALREQLLRQLVDKRQFALARRYYSTLPGASPEVPGMLALTKSSTDSRHVPISWQPYTIEGIQAAIVADANGELEIRGRVDSVTRGPLARKIVQLSPGHYSIEAWQRISNDANGASASLTMACANASDGRSLWKSGAPLSQQLKAIRGEFIVPADCPFQTAVIDAFGGTGVYGADIEVGPIRLEKLQANSAK